MPKKILVVEDHPDSREIIVLSVRRLGYEAIEAADGEKGVEKALAECPDLIIMDLGLPGISGIEATIRIKQDPKTVHIPIIAHTAWREQEYKAKALEAGMAAYMAKPVTTQLLKQTIERFVNPSLPEAKPPFNPQS